MLTSSFSLFFYFALFFNSIFSNSLGISQLVPYFFSRIRKMEFPRKNSLCWALHLFVDQQVGRLRQLPVVKFYDCQTTCCDDQALDKASRKIQKVTLTHWLGAVEELRHAELCTCSSTGRQAGRLRQLPAAVTFTTGAGGRLEKSRTCTTAS